MENVQNKNQARERALQEVKMYQSNDWELKEETPEYFLLERKQKMSVALLILGLIFYIIPGLIYWYVKSQPETKKIIK